MGSHNDSSYIVPQERLFVNNKTVNFKEYSQLGEEFSAGVACVRGPGWRAAPARIRTHTRWWREMGWAGGFWVVEGWVRVPAAGCEIICYRLRRVDMAWFLLASGGASLIKDFDLHGYRRGVREKVCYHFRWGREKVCGCLSAGCEIICYRLPAGQVF